MKRFSSLCLLVVMLYNIAGYYMVVKVMRRHLKERVKTVRLHQQVFPGLQVVKESKFTLSAGKSKLVFVQQDEFRLDGEMYDIISTVEQGDEVWYYCVKDKQEDKLLASLQQLVNENTTSKNAKQLLKSLLKDYIPMEIQGLNLPAILVEQNYFVSFFADFSKGHLQLPANPPEAIS
ncbi:MAG: hypothetical protein K1X81_14625 [Bacteroidia bacterium]|nr:hypothetical protein [Bacteroidia bacterium]